MIGLGSDKDIGFLQKGRKMVSLSNRCVIKRLPTVPVISSISPKLVHWGVPLKHPFESLQSTFVIQRSFNTRFIFCLIFSILIPFINWNCGHFILLIHKSILKMQFAQEILYRSVIESSATVPVISVNTPTVNWRIPQMKLMTDM